MECALCPRQCGADRKHILGVCGARDDKIRIGRVMLHKWEEPCISGENGTGAIFFGGCTMQCVYCQNAPLSQGHSGKEVDENRLPEIMLDLQRQGAHSIDLVTPTHYADHLIWAVRAARTRGLHIPIVYNTSGYERVQTIRALQNTVDVYLTDFKYFDSALGKLYSGVPDYFEQASRALEEMVRLTGRPYFAADGIMQKGVIVRHLLLPEHVEDSKAVLQYLYNRFGEDIWFSIMNQYTPTCRLPFAELNRKVTASEYQELVDFAVSIGIVNGLIQEEGTQSESFIPSFNGEGLE